MKTTEVTWRSVSIRSIVFALAAAVVSGYASVVDAESDTDPPFTGVFARPQPSAMELADYAAAVAAASAPPIPIPRGDYLIDDKNRSNELIVLADSTNTALVALLPELASGDSLAEDVIVNGIEQSNLRIGIAFANPIDARYVIQRDRLDTAARNRLAHDDPELTLQRYVVLRYADIDSAQFALDALQPRLGAETIVMNGGSGSFSWAPNDPYFAIQPGATNAAKYQWGLHTMNLPAAWDTTKGNSYVAVIDSGIALDNSAATTDDIIPNADLVANYRPQFYERIYWNNPSNPSRPNLPMHGSHVSGIVASTAKNSSGISGACPSCSFSMVEMNVQDWASVASATNRAVLSGFQVFNMSFGANGNVTPACPATGSPNAVECAALGAATSSDVVMVAAAGNYSRSTPDFPAKEPSVLAVAGAQLSVPGNPASWQPWYFGMACDSPNVTGTGCAAPLVEVLSRSVWLTFKHSSIERWSTDSLASV